MFVHGIYKLLGKGSILSMHGLITVIDSYSVTVVAAVAAVVVVASIVNRYVYSLYSSVVT